MAEQNIIGQGLPGYLAVGTKTLSITVTVPTAGTSYGYLGNKVSGLSSLGDAYCSISPCNKTDFQDFWAQNPMYISKMNIRCSDSTYMPTAVVFKTPNIFTGTTDSQIVDVSANMISTQFQSNIVTLNTDIMLGRMTTIDIQGTTVATKSVTLDLTISHFASLEVGLQSFLKA